MRSTVRQTPRRCQRRAEVVTVVPERRHAAAALQALHELDVLHQRQRREAAERLEDGAAHEDRLVARGDAGEAGAHADEAPDQPVAPAGRVQREREESPDDVGDGERPRYRLAEPRAAACRHGGRGARPRGRRPRRRSSARRGRAARRARRPRGVRRRLASRHGCRRRRRSSSPMPRAARRGERLRQGRCFIERRNDDGDHGRRRCNHL